MPGNYHSYSICTLTNDVAQINAIRPYVQLFIGNSSTSWLYDTGASVSVISAKFFKTLNHKGRKAPTVGSLTSASNTQLQITDRRFLTVSYKGKTAEIPVYIAKSLNENAIAGMDLINTLGICYDPRIQSFVSAVSDSPANALVLTTAQMCLNPWEAKTVRLRLTNWTPGDTAVVVDIGTPEIPALFPNAALATVFDENKVFFQLKNCSGVEIRIPRGFPVGTAEAIGEISAVKEEQFLDIKESWPQPLTDQERKKFLTYLHLNVPESEKEAYQQLLVKNYDVFSKSTDDLGQARHFAHTIQLKDFDPVYRKQFRIPEQHNEALQLQVKEWLKIGIIEPCHSRYNSSIFVVPKKRG